MPYLVKGLLNISEDDISLVFAVYIVGERLMEKCKCGMDASVLPESMLSVYGALNGSLWSSKCLVSLLLIILSSILPCSSNSNIGR